ncbi:hypothetical protein [Microbacterium sp.]|uniref:hypothetical protein n=1 Tax=Microbacterium sp. TaxID=51671 RepID=UPI003F9ABEE8
MNGTLRTRTRLLLALPIAAAAISLAACSGVGATGGGDSRPSADELSAGITTILEDAGQGDLLTSDQIDCIAGEFLDSKVSDEDLSNLAAGKDEQTDEDAKTLVSQTMSDAATTCATTE